MTFDLELHIQGHSAMVLQQNCKNMAHLVGSTLQHVQFWMDSFPVWHKLKRAGQRSRSHGSFKFLGGGIIVDH